MNFWMSSPVLTSINVYAPSYLERRAALRRCSLLWRVSYRLHRSSPRWASRLLRRPRAARSSRLRRPSGNTISSQPCMEDGSPRYSTQRSVRGPKRAARRSRLRLHHPRFACSVRERRNRGSISITHGGTYNPRRKPNCNRRGSHRWPGWEGLRHRNHIVPRAEDGAMKGTYRKAELVLGLTRLAGLPQEGNSSQSPTWVAGGFLLPPAFPPQRSPV